MAISRFEPKILYISSARQQFVQTLGQSYDTCTDRYYLISLGNTDWWNVMVYTHLMKHLELICSTGFDGNP
uniref:Uncharacterized protein n=1 Tax=Caenorhabditis japonica TaxID=281687 RepID=A0A8R1IN95_CAEJA